MFVQQYQNNLISNLYLVKQLENVAYGWTPIVNQSMDLNHLRQKRDQAPNPSRLRSMLNGAITARQTLFRGTLDFMVGSGPVAPGAATRLFREPLSKDAWLRYGSEITRDLRTLTEKTPEEKSRYLQREILDVQNFSRIGVAGTGAATTVLYLASSVAAVHTAVNIGFEYLAARAGLTDRARRDFLKVTATGAAAITLWTAMPFLVTLYMLRLANHGISAVGLLVGSVYWAH